MFLEVYEVASTTRAAWQTKLAALDHLVHTTWKWSASFDNTAGLRVQIDQGAFADGLVRTGEPLLVSVSGPNMNIQRDVIAASDMVIPLGRIQVGTCSDFTVTTTIGFAPELQVDELLGTRSATVSVENETLVSVPFRCTIPAQATIAVSGLAGAGVLGFLVYAIVVPESWTGFRRFLRWRMANKRRICTCLDRARITRQHQGESRLGRAQGPEDDRRNQPAPRSSSELN